MKNKKTLGILALSMLTMTILAGCTPKQETQDPQKETTSSTTSSGTQTVTSGEKAAPVKEFTMESYTNVVNGEYHPKFSIAQMNVIKGDRVVIHIKTTSGMHDFNLDEFGIKSATPKDETTTIEFTADKVGSFVYYCSMPGHRAAGHWGTLIVDEPSDK